MSELRIREIIDDLNSLGGMTPEHHTLITELVATCLIAARPHPQTSTERVRAHRERMKRETVSVSEFPPKEKNQTPEKNIPQKPSVSTPKGTRLPEGWSPTENLLIFGRELGFTDDELKFETEAFRDHFEASARANAVKRDWGKAWRGWMREQWRRRGKVVPFVKKTEGGVLIRPDSEEYEAWKRHALKISDNSLLSRLKYHSGEIKVPSRWPTR